MIDGRIGVKCLLRFGLAMNAVCFHAVSPLCNHVIHLWHQLLEILTDQHVKWNACNHHSYYSLPEPLKCFHSSAAGISKNRQQRAIWLCCWNELHMLMSCISAELSVSAADIISELSALCPVLICDLEFLILSQKIGVLGAEICSPACVWFIILSVNPTVLMFWFYESTDEAEDIRVMVDISVLS